MTFKEFINKLPFTTVAIVYFFVSGGLYIIIGFWSTFKLDVTNFISLSDIPKSFVLPFALTNGLVLIHLFLNFVTTKHYKDPTDENKESTKKTGFKRFFSMLFSLNSLIMITFIVSFGLLDKYQLSPTYWSISIFAIGYMLVFKLADYSHFKAYLPSQSLRTFLATMLIILPLVCFLTGKYLSLKIYNNEDYLIYKGLTDNNSKSDTLKLVGFIGDKIIVSSLDNKQIVLINQSSSEETRLIKK